MKLTRFTDYSLRVLIHLGLQENTRVTIREISGSYGISRNHLMKVVSLLTRKGYLVARRGPGGGITLARPACDICLADVVMDMEDDLHVVECFDRDGECVIGPVCELKCILDQALSAFLDTLRRYTLADLLTAKSKLSRILSLEKQTA